MVFGMTACGGGDTTDGNKDTKPTSSATNNQNNQSSANNTQNNTSGDGEQVVLRFASWALGTEEENNLERQMIAAFEDAHPNIKIEIADDIIGAGSWNEALATAAAGGSLPDVSLISELPIAVANKWALDVSSYANADSNWSKIPSSLIESGQYNDKQFGIPTAMNIAGLFINTDLFEEMNVTPLQYGYSWDEFMGAVEKLHSPSKGITALKFANDFVNFLPYLWDENQGWYTYDGEKMYLDSTSFIRSVKETSNLYKYSWLGLTPDQKAVTAGAEAGDWEAWNQGYCGIWYDGSWCCEGYKNTSTYNIEFVGLPDGKSVIIPDY